MAIRFRSLLITVVSIRMGVVDITAKRPGISPLLQSPRKVVPLCCPDLRIIGILSLH